MKRIFLDHAASRRNPNSMHAEGRAARATLDSCRQTIATYIGASPDQIFFAPSASLVNHFLLNEFSNVAASAIEHQSILNHPSVKVLIPVGKLGQAIVSRSVLNSRAKTPAGGFLPGEESRDEKRQPDLISIALANHEIGTIQDLATIKKSYPSIPLHSDASAAFTKIPIDVKRLGVDFLTLSGAKLGVPGVAALYAKNPTPKLYNFPFGTPIVPAISALDKFLKTEVDLPKVYKLSVRPLRNHLRTRLATEIPNITINGDPDHFLPNVLNVSFAGAEGESILLMLDEAGIAVSTGSACALGQPSHVIQAITGDPVASHNSIRFSLHPSTTKADIDYTADHLVKIIKKLREMSTL